MAIGDLFLARINFNVNGNPASFGMHYKLSLGADGEDPSGALAAGMAGELGDLEDFTAENVQIASLEVRAVQGEAHPPALGVFSFTTGGYTGEALPLTKAARFRLEQTELPGRYNGKIFFPGISEGATSGNNITDTPMLLQMENFFRALSLVTFDSGVTTYEFLHCIKTKAGVVPSNPRVSNVVATPVIGSQRLRRTKARGVYA